MATEPIDPVKNIGDDVTATFEADPKFTEPTPGSEGSSDNVEAQRAALSMRDTDDVEDEDEEDDADVDEDEEFDDEDEEDEQDLDDDDEGLDDDEEDLDDDEDEDEDDAEELVASPALRADGLLGYEDEADDVEKGRSEEEGSRVREREERKDTRPGTPRGTHARATDTDEDDDAGDVAPGVDESDTTADDLDTDRVAAQAHFAAQYMAAREACAMRSHR